MARSAGGARTVALAAAAAMLGVLCGVGHIASAAPAASAAPYALPAEVAGVLVPPARFEELVLGAYAAALVVFAPFSSDAQADSARAPSCATLGVSLTRLALSATRGRALIAAVDTTGAGGAADAARFAPAAVAECAGLVHFALGDDKAARGGEVYDHAAAGVASGGEHVARLVGWMAARAPDVLALRAGDETFDWLKRADGAGGVASTLQADRAGGAEEGEAELATLDETHVPKVLALVDGVGEAGAGPNVRLAAGAFAPWLEFAFVDVGADEDLEAVRALGGPLGKARRGDVFATFVGDGRVHFMRGPDGAALHNAGMQADGSEPGDDWGKLFYFLRQVGAKLGLPPPGGPGTAQAFMESQAGGKAELGEVVTLRDLKAICGRAGDVCVLAIIGPKQFDESGKCTPALATTLLDVAARRGGAAIGYAFVDAKKSAPRLPGQLGVDMYEDLPRVLAMRLDSGEYALSESYEPAHIMAAIDRAAARRALEKFIGGMPDFRIGAVHEDEL